MGCLPRMHVWAMGLVLAVAAIGPMAVAANEPAEQSAEQWLDIDGIVVSVEQSRPHSVLILDADGRRWQVELGAPWRNRRAGLETDQLQEGQAVRVQGHLALDGPENRIKAVRLVIDGRNYDLYPNHLR